MNQAEYQRHRRQLDEELRAGIEMLQAGHRAKVEALDARWEEPPEETLASEPEPPAPPPEPTAPAPQPRRERRRGGEVQADVEAALEKVGTEFLKRDILQALGYEPHRTSLHRALWELQKAGVIEVQLYGIGRRATRYRKVEQKAEG
jgi:hypothetical protein